MAEFSFGHLFAGSPDLGKIEELVRCCERRQTRAADKLAAAQAECDAAEAAYQLAVSARADWIANGPDAQLLMF